MTSEASPEEHIPFASVEQGGVEPAQPVFFSEERGYWMVTRREDVERVLLDTKTFTNEFDMRPRFAPEVLKVLSSYRPIPASLGSIDPPVHTSRRKLMNVAFTRKRLEELGPAIGAIAAELVERIAPQGHADLVKEFSDWLPLRVFALLTGIGEDCYERLMQWRRDWILLAWYPADTATEVERARSLVEMQHFFFDLVEDHRKTPREDVLSTMIEACLEGEKPLTDYQLVAELMGVLEAGQESVSALVSNSIHHLLSDRVQWQDLVQHPDLIGNAVEETLRLDAGIRGVMRQASSEARIGSVTIPAKAKLCVKLASANRDASRYSRAERFDLRRKPECPHVSFGKGAHFCIGSPLARIEGRKALEVLVARLPSLRLAPDFEFRSFGNLAFQMPKSLSVEWDVNKVE